MGLTYNYRIIWLRIDRSRHCRVPSPEKIDIWQQLFLPIQPHRRPPLLLAVARLPCPVITLLGNWKWMVVGYSCEARSTARKFLTNNRNANRKTASQILLSSAPLRSSSSFLQSRMVINNFSARQKSITLNSTCCSSRASPNQNSLLAHCPWNGFCSSAVIIAG